jgi:hypothetical protein
LSASHFEGPLYVNDKKVTGNTAITSVSAADGAAAVGAAPTKEEYDVVVTLANSTKAQLNALLTQLRNAGIILSS